MRKKLFLTYLTFGIMLILAGVFQSTSAQSEPRITHGPISGEVSADSIMLWARGSQSGTLQFVVLQDGAEITAAEIAIDAETDYTGEVEISDLEPDTTYTYTVAHTEGGEARSGSFTTAPTEDNMTGFSFVFGGCLGGQGYCRNPETGWTIFNTMADQNPDFFLMVGDGVYVDSACPVDDNRNVSGAETVATDLAGFYGRYQYHLEDTNYADFLANTPIFVTWDDHEILDNFAAQDLLRLNPDLLNEGRQAFFDYWPLASNADNQIYRQFAYGAQADFFVLDTRSYRDPLVNWDPSPVTGEHKTMLGAEQFTWLQNGLSESDSTWKFIVTSVPISYPTGFPQPQVDGRDGWANGADKSGYETEMMRLLFFIESHDIENVVFLTADTHWPFAIEYDPDLDGEVNFIEFGSSPLSAITLPPGDVDQTFNPNVLFAEGEFAGSTFNFGQVSVSDDGELTMRIVTQDGTELYSVSRLPQ